MASIFKPIKVTWAGKEHTVKPTYAMIQKIESQGISIAGLVNKTQKGETPFTQVSSIFATLLQSVGVKVSSEQIYAYLFMKCTQSQVSDIVTLVCTAFFPEVDEGNEQPPEEGEK